jgi:hypothetical protein
MKYRIALSLLLAAAIAFAFVIHSGNGDSPAVQQPAPSNAAPNFNL